MAVDELHAVRWAEQDEPLAPWRRARAKSQQATVGQGQPGLQVQLALLVAERVVEHAALARVAGQEQGLHLAAVLAQGEGAGVVLHHDQPAVPASHGRARAHVSGQIQLGPGPVRVAQGPQLAQHGAQRLARARLDLEHPVPPRDGHVVRRRR
jgi:hypothetical protein